MRDDAYFIGYVHKYAGARIFAQFELLFSLFNFFDSMIFYAR